MILGGHKLHCLNAYLLCCAVSGNVMVMSGFPHKHDLSILSCCHLQTCSILRWKVLDKTYYYFLVKDSAGCKLSHKWTLENSNKRNTQKMYRYKSCTVLIEMAFYSRPYTFINLMHCLPKHEISQNMLSTLNSPVPKHWAHLLLSASEC